MQITLRNITVSLPMPIFVVVEDVGWWQGKDGSTYNEPFRTVLSEIIAWMITAPLPD